MTHLRPGSAMIAAIGRRNQIPIPIPTPSARKKRKPEVTFSEVSGGSAEIAPMTGRGGQSPTVGIIESYFVPRYRRSLGLFEACQIRAQKDF